MRFPLLIMTRKGLGRLLVKTVEDQLPELKKMQSILLTTRKQLLMMTNQNLLLAQHINKLPVKYQPKHWRNPPLNELSKKKADEAPVGSPELPSES